MHTALRKQKRSVVTAKKLRFMVHKYESFSKTEPKTEASGFFSGLFAAIASALMEGEPTGDYKCKVCGTNLSTPDYLD